MKGIEDYSFEEKNRWRVMLYSRIVGRLKQNGRLGGHMRQKEISPSNAIVLYLSGEQDLDREILLRKGFRWENLIAVDISKKKVEKLRSQGKIAIQGDIIDVIGNWTNKTKKLSVINADFCSGLTDKICINLRLALSVGAVDQNAVVAVNLQHGREAGKIWKKFFREEVYNRKEEFQDHFQGDFLHRGRQLFAIWRNSLDRKITPDDMESLSSVNLMIAHNPSFLSYRGKNTTMDTVIFNWPIKYDEALRKADLNHLSTHGFNDFSNFSLQRKIAACLAVRTMKARSAA